MATAKTTTRIKPKAAGKTLGDFRAAHDKNTIVPTKIRAGLAALGDGWEYEPEFIKVCGVSTLDFSRFREQFSDFYVNISGAKSSKRAWAGTKANATKMRDML